MPVNVIINQPGHLVNGKKLLGLSYRLGLHKYKEVLHAGVVPAVPLPLHALMDPEGLQMPDIVLMRVGPSYVRVDYGLAAQPSAPEAAHRILHQAKVYVAAGPV